MHSSDPGDSAVTAKGARSPAGAARPARGALEALFCAQLPHIEAIAAAVARRSGFPPDECPDIVAWVRLRLLEDDYAILAKHRGESSVEGYLAVVVARLVRDYRMKAWGRWRPSAIALRQGSAAVRLETLTRRDRMPYEQAVRVMRSEGFGLCERELLRMHRLLPDRTPMRPREVDIGDPALEQAFAVLPDVERSATADDYDSRARLLSAVDAAVRTLPAEEQLIIRLRYGEGLAIADVARALGIPEKPLYRRLPAIVRRVREHLEAAGISQTDAEEVYAGD